MSKTAYIIKHKKILNIKTILENKKIRKTEFRTNKDFKKYKKIPNCESGSINAVQVKIPKTKKIK